MSFLTRLMGTNFQNLALSYCGIQQCLYRRLFLPNGIDIIGKLVDEAFSNVAARRNHACTIPFGHPDANFGFQHLAVQLSPCD